MKVLYVYADTPQEWNCSQWNCVSPANAINRTEKHTAKTIQINEFITNTENCQNLCSEADIIVVERNYFGDTLTMIQYWKSRNKTVIGIFDDAYDIMHPQNPSYPFWTYGEVKFLDDKKVEKTAKILPSPIEQFKWGIKMLKGIQVPSVNLAKDWSRFGNTYFVHNFLDIEKYENITPLFPHDKEEIYIGWCGSMSHYASFVGSGVADALKKIVQKHPNVTVLISGDRRIYDLLQFKKKIFQPFVPAEQWTPLLKSLDIGLAPLSGEFDKRRSWIKTLEWCALKVPWIATNYPTYDEMHDYGLMTENGYKNWEQSLSEMIENYPKYKEISETQAYAFAQAQSIDKNIEKVTLALYEKLINEPYPIDVREIQPVKDMNRKYKYVEKEKENK